MKDTCIDVAEWLDEPDEPDAPLARAFDWGVGLCAYPFADGNGYNYYPLAWSQLDEPIKVVSAIRHLTEKVWFTNEMCADLIDVVSKHFGWRQGGGL